MAASELGYCKVCDLPDFQDPELRELIRDVYRSDLSHFGPDFPTGSEFRKHWEVSMTLRAFRHPETVGEGKGRTSNNNGVAAECECPRKLRISLSVFEAGPIRCDTCVRWASPGKWRSAFR